MNVKHVLDGMKGIPIGMLCVTWIMEKALHLGVFCQWCTVGSEFRPI